MSKLSYTAFTKPEVYQKLYFEAHSNAYTSYIRGLRCELADDFFREVSASFQFPFYFGENWAAFDECICDLEWLKFERIYMIVDDFSKMFLGDCHMQDLLIDYLEDAVRFWDKENISFEVNLNN